MAVQLQNLAVGFAFRVTLTSSDGVVVDCSAATAKRFVFQRPDGTDLVVDVDFITDGNDGKLFYLTVAGDINQAGTWKLQAHVATSGWDEFSSVGKFKVKENL